MTIQSMQSFPGYETMRITGFSAEELDELGSMEQYEMIQTVLERLDRENGGIGTCWHNGNGIYGVWVRDGAVFVRIGSSCD